MIITIACSVLTTALVLRLLTRTKWGRRYLNSKMRDAELDSIYMNREYADPRRKPKDRVPN